MKASNAPTVHADDEHPLEVAVGAIHELHLPNGCAVWSAGGLRETGGPSPVVHVDADVVMSDLAGFGVLDFEVYGRALDEVRDQAGDVNRLEGFAVVAREDVIYGEAGLRTQMAGELTGEVVLDHDRPLAGLEDGPGLGVMEGVNVLEVELVGRDARPGELSGRLPNDAPRRAPPDQRDF